MTTARRRLPWLLTVGAIGLATVATFAARSARSTTENVRAEMAMLREWIEADEAFIMGDQQRAIALYSSLAARTGDSLGFLERRTFVAEQQSREGEPVTSSRDFARLAARLEQTEQLLDDLRDGQSAQQISEQLEAKFTSQIDRQLQEIERLRSAVERGRARTVLRFPADKSGEIMYIGDSREGRAHGFGVGIWTTGSTYEGDWANSKRHGIGTFIWPDKERYEGEFLDDRRTGKGVYVWKNGRRWEGEWLDDMRHGDGVLYEADGKVRLRGRWEKDKLAEEYKG